jgi:phenylalanyl-tRNA synthetase beta chain
MRVSWNWLGQYVDLPAGADERRILRQRLEMSGLAIDSIHRPGAGAEGIYAGRVASVAGHPDAASLFVVELDLGPRGSLRVVSGADNYAPGDMVPVVVPGGRLPGGSLVEAVTLRGVPSEGMMCSAAELGLGEGELAAGGILILPPETPAGADCVPLLGLDDEILELDLTPNYAVYCQSMLGVAGEVAAITGGQVREPVGFLAEAAAAAAEAVGPLSSATAVTRAWGPAAAAARVEIAAPDLCSRYAGALFDGVRIAPSPWWLQQRLIAAGQRPINNIVDVTNYVMLEMGQPLHAFDFGLVRQGKIIVRRAAHGEVVRTLDGVDRALPPDTLVIADAERAIAIAGVMGGQNTEIGPDTERVFLESAHFLRTSVRRASRSLGLRSEASSRFEKGLDPAVAGRAIERVSQLWAELGAARRIPGLVDVVARATPPRRIMARSAYLRTLTGMDLTTAAMIELLGRLGIPATSVADPVTAEEALLAEVPTRRLDIEGPADLGEEVARVHGYDRLQGALPSLPMATANLPARRRAAVGARRTLLGCGLDEMVTFAYHPAAEFDRVALPADHPWRRAIGILNPMSEEQGVMRTSLVPNLLRVASYNSGHGVEEIHGFEVGRVYLAQSLPLGELPEEPMRCAMIMAGPAPGSANRRDGSRPVDFFGLKGCVEALLSSMRIEGASFLPFKAPFLHPGRAAEVRLRGGRASGPPIGWMGELHPEVQSAYDLRQRVYLAELDFEAMVALAGPVPMFTGLPRFPALERDLAFILPVGVPAAAVESAIREHGSVLLEQLRLFDVYQGPQVAAGCRSLAYALRLRSPERTLTDEEADVVCGRMVQAVAALGGELRR